MALEKLSAWFDGIRGRLQKVQGFHELMEELTYPLTCTFDLDCHAQASSSRIEYSPGSIRAVGQIKARWHNEDESAFDKLVLYPPGLAE